MWIQQVLKYYTYEAAELLEVTTIVRVKRVVINEEAIDRVASQNELASKPSSHTFFAKFLAGAAGVYHTEYVSQVENTLELREPPEHH